MIRSMTAFARSSGEDPLAELTWELRSVNHRYLEVFVRLPEEFRAMEPLVRERVSARLGRGKLECALRCQWSPARTAGIEVDEARLAAVLDACRIVETRSAEATSPGVMDLLRWPGVVLDPEIDKGSLQQHTMELLDSALDELIETREREGGQIREMLLTRLEGVAEQVARARARLPEVRDSIRQKMASRVAELEIKADPDRLEQELALLAQKIDIDEELDRLDAHVAETRRVLERDEPVGRRLDFLMQEFNREANTLGSKSADSETTSIAVELKVLIEQMREQIQNVE